MEHNDHHGKTPGQQKLRRGNGKVPKLSRANEKYLVALYEQGQTTTHQIAARFGVSASYVTNAAKRAGLTLRHRGRRPSIEPSTDVQLMLLEAWTTRYVETAARFGTSKQNIARLVKRWKPWATAEFGPRNIGSEKSGCKSAKERARPEARRHVICFRISDSQMSKLQVWARSPHSIARALFLRSLEHT